MATLAALTALLVALLAAPASAEPDPAAEAQAGLLADQLTADLADSQAGSYLDASGQLVVNVTNEAAAAAVTAAGAQARTVTHSMADLEAAQAALDPATLPDGVSYGVDVVSNSLFVRVPTGVDASAFVAAARATGVRVKVERTAAAPELQAFYGGQAIYNTRGGRCSAGFITRASSGTRYVVTAGHCTELGGSWGTTAGSSNIGPSAATSFPGNDFGAVRITNAQLDPRGGVLSNGQFIDITSAGRVPVRGNVCKTGSTTGTTCGQVLRYNVTVNYGGGDVVSGLTETNVCTQRGDSGGALYAGSSGQGITSGGTIIGCSSSSFRAYFQPLDEALSSYGLTLL